MSVQEILILDSTFNFDVNVNLFLTNRLDLEGVVNLNIDSIYLSIYLSIYKHIFMTDVTQNHHFMP